MVTAGGDKRHSSDSRFSEVLAIAAVPSIGRATRVERDADAHATHGLYERYAAQILGFCVNQLGSRDEAEDAMQSTFLNAHRALQRGVTPEAELAWLFKIAHNVCLTRRRSRYRRGRVESPSDFDAVQDVLPAPTRESADELIRLTDALSHMPDNQRRAILLREWQGLSYHEIATELSVSQSAVETLIFRARRTLAARLKDEREDQKPRLLARARRAVDAGTLLMGLKTLFEGGAAVKAAAAAVAVTGTVVVASSPRQPDAEPTPAPVTRTEPAHAPAPTQVVPTRAVAARTSAPPPKLARESTAEPKPAPARERTAPRAARAAEARAPAPVAEAEQTPSLTPAQAAGAKPAKSNAAPEPSAAEPTHANPKPKAHELRQPPGHAKKADSVAAEPQPVAPGPAPAATPTPEPAAVADDGNGNGNGGAKDKEHPDKK